VRGDEPEVYLLKVFAMRLAHVMISVPLLIGLVQLAPPAVAQAMDPAQATTLLAKSHALNLKCNILGDAEGQQLRDFVARAEISLAEKASVSAARKAIASGREDAKTAACDDTNRKMVGDVLAAAKTAVETPVAAAAAPQAIEPEKPAMPETTALAVANPEPTPAAPKIIKKPAKQTVVLKPTKPVARVKAEAAPKTVAKTEKPIKTKPGLQGYAKVAETYYAALKCGNLSPGKIQRLYKTVLTSHQQALTGNRPGDIKVMLRNAEARAGSRSCS
jgi:outer membrane biosynthesis protein TonB